MIKYNRYHSETFTGGTRTPLKSEVTSKKGHLLHSSKLCTKMLAAQGKNSTRFSLLRNPSVSLVSISFFSFILITGVYPVDEGVAECGTECIEFAECYCSLCVCCNICSESCHCPSAIGNLDAKLAQLLGLNVR